MTDRPVVTVDVAALMLGTEVDAIHRLAEEGELELIDAPDGSVDVCMASLDALQTD